MPSQIAGYAVLPIPPPVGDGWSSQETERCGTKPFPGFQTSLELYVKILPFLTKLGMKNGKQQLLKHFKTKPLSIYPENTMQSSQFLTSETDITLKLLQLSFLRPQQIELSHTPL